MQRQLIDNTIPGCYYDKKRDSYYIKYKGITRRGFTKKEAEKYSYELRHGYMTIEQIDKEKHPDRCSTDKDTEMFYNIIDAFLKKKYLDTCWATYSKAKHNADTRIKTVIPNKRFSEISIIDCNQVKERLSKEKISTRTRNYTINLLKAIIHYGMKLNHIKDDPTEDMTLFKESYEEIMARKEKADTVWSIEEYNSFISCVEEQHFKVLFRLMDWSGLRLGEAQALKWRQYSNGKISIIESITTQTEEGGWSITTPKTPNSIREITLDEDTIEILDSFKKEEMECGYFDDNWFICGRDKPLARSTINRRREKGIKESGVRKITNHQMRHSHGSILIEAGAPLANVSRRLGHSNVNVTAKYYIHPTKEGEEKLVDLLEKCSHNLLTK